MSATNDIFNAGSTETAADRPWRDVLSEETSRLDSIGIGGMIVSIELSDAGNLDRIRERVARLLTVALARTDRIGVLGETRIAVFHSPAPSFVYCIEFANRIDSLLDAAEIDATVGFAHRRTGEPLSRTLARSDAEVDRAVFRSHHSDGHLTLD